MFMNIFTSTIFQHWEENFVVYFENQTNINMLWFDDWNEAPLEGMSFCCGWISCELNDSTDKTRNK